MTWYMIPGFNGYEINTDGVVRSMKMMNADPGHLLKLNKDGYYTLSDNCNRRVRRTPSQLIEITFNSGAKLVPRLEEAIYLGGRNKRFYFDKEPKIKETKYAQGMDFSSFIIDEEKSNT